MAALAVPWQLTRSADRGRSTIPVRRTTVYRRDPYWFAWQSVTHGADQLAVSIPATGPGSAGSTFPTNQPQVDEVIVTEADAPPVYGVNTAQPVPAGRNTTGGI